MSLPLLSSLPDLLARLFSPGLDPVSFRSRTAQLLREVGECQIISFAVLDPATRKLDIDFDPFFPEFAEGLAGFGKHMAKYPCFSFDPTVAGGKPFLRGDFLSDVEFYASDIYLEGFKLGGISDHAAVLLPSNDGTLFFIGLEKRDGATFQPAHRDWLEALQPHLGNARLLAQAFATVDHALADPSVFSRAGLSPREADGLALMASGKSNAEIAIILNISLATVKGHVASIFDKLGVDNRHAASQRARDLMRPPVTSPAPTTKRVSTVAAGVTKRGSPLRK